MSQPKFDLENPVVVSQSGPILIVAQGDDLEQKNLNGKSQSFNLDTGHIGPVKSLQHWFKWILYLREVNPPVPVDEYLSQEPV